MRIGGVWVGPEVTDISFCPTPGCWKQETDEPLQVCGQEPLLPCGGDYHSKYPVQRLCASHTGGLQSASSPCCLLLLTSTPGVPTTSRNSRRIRPDGKGFLEECLQIFYQTLRTSTCFHTLP